MLINSGDELRSEPMPGPGSRVRTERSNFSVSITDLTDDLLVEILHRLPCKSATQCKSVCKRWFNLISCSDDPYFLRHFLRRQQPKAAELPSAVVAQYNYVVLGSFKYLYSITDYKDDDAVSRSSGFSLNFLPCHRPESDPVWILASFNDLLLCCPSSSDHSAFYICNPVTKHWIELPPPPPLPSGTLQDFRIVFICDPYYCCSHNVVNPRYGFKVVRLLPPWGPDSGPVVDFFSSDTGEWKRSDTVLPRRCWFRRSLVAYNGMLVWYGGDGKGEKFSIDGFMNPLDHGGDATFTVTGAPDGFVRVPDDRICLGVCGGCLRMSQMLRGRNKFELTVWELRNSGTAGKSWVLEQKLNFSCDEMKLRYFWQVVAFHPSDGDTLYLLCRALSHRVFSCNIRTKALKLLSVAPAHLSCYSIMVSDVFSIVLPSWPTPVPITRTNETDIPESYQSCY